MFLKKYNPETDLKYLIFILLKYGLELEDVIAMQDFIIENPETFKSLKELKQASANKGRNKIN